MSDEYACPDFHSCYSADLGTEEGDFMPESSRKGPVPFDPDRFKRFYPDTPSRIPPNYSSEVPCNAVRQRVREDAERSAKP